MHKNLTRFENKFQKIEENNSTKYLYKESNLISNRYLYLFFYNCNEQLISFSELADYYGGGI